MPIGTSDGQYFEDGMDQRINAINIRPVAMQPNKNVGNRSTPQQLSESRDYDPGMVYDTEEMKTNKKLDESELNEFGPGKPISFQSQQGNFSPLPDVDYNRAGPSETGDTKSLIRVPNTGPQQGDKALTITRDLNEYDVEGDLSDRSQKPVIPAVGVGELGAPLMRHKMNVAAQQGRPNVASTFAQVPQRMMDAYSNIHDSFKNAIDDVMGKLSTPTPNRLSILNPIRGMGNPSTGEDVNIIKSLFQAGKSALGFVKDVGDAFQGKEVPTWAMDPQTGEVHTNPETFEKAADFAGLATLGPGVVPEKIMAKAANGTLGSFAGVRSETANLPLLKEAQAFEEQGLNPKSIERVTGWFRGADNRWKYEIPVPPNGLNKKAFQEYDLLRGDAVKHQVVLKLPTLKPDEIAQEAETFISNLFRKSRGKEEVNSPVSRSVPLSSILNHGALFEAYPFLKDIKVIRMPYLDTRKGYLGWSNGDTIALAPQESHDLLYSTLMHEVQHAIQDHEGFSRGSNKELYATPRWEDMMKEFGDLTKETTDKLFKLAGGDRDRLVDFRNAMSNEPLLDQIRANPDIPPGWMSTATGQELTKMRSDLDLLKNTGMYEPYNKVLRGLGIVEKHNELSRQSYYRTKGEVEARHVQLRMGGVDKELKDALYGISPLDTEEHVMPRSMQEWSPMDPGWLKMDWLIDEIKDDLTKRGSQGGKSASADTNVKQFRNPANDNLASGWQKWDIRDLIDLAVEYGEAHSTSNFYSKSPEEQSRILQEMMKK